jgi:hypothetical protein
LRYVLEKYGLVRSRLLVSSLPPQKILALEEAAANTAFPPLHSLTSYWRVDARNIGDRTAEAIAAIDMVPEVDLAYAELAVTKPQSPPDDNPLAAQQGYLDEADTGIGARLVWDQLEGDEIDVGLVDVEQDWFLEHQDFENKNFELIHGDNRREFDEDHDGRHGTRVLGVLIAENNALGGIGIAYGIKSVGLVSHYKHAEKTDLHVAEGIAPAITQMKPGDVLLLEVDRDGLPTEIDDADFDAIRLASAHGIVVVEAAGNKGSDLDDLKHAKSGDLILRRKPPDQGFRDSGAVLVGAAKPSLPHNWFYGSNYGSRVDCYAWGDLMWTCDVDLELADGQNDSGESYTGEFGNTSGAAAIVAGAALVLQWKYQSTGSRLSPLQMRRLLSDPDLGTPQGPLDEDKTIGVMPNLPKLFEELDLVSDVYVRDNVSDTGAVPSSGVISASPDIIVLPEKVFDPQQSFGEGSGTENSTNLGFEVKAGANNFIYVRLRNRGLGDAVDATATVYWSEVATLVTPDLWHKVGTTFPVTVPEGDQLVVAGPIVWPAAEIPASGHYCYVALTNHPRDPGPLPPWTSLHPDSPAFDFDDFRAFVRNHNNVTWRNFNVIDASAAAGSTALSLLFNGGPDLLRMFDFEFIQRLPEGAEIWMEAAPTLATKLDPDRMLKRDARRGRDAVRLRLPALPALLLRDIPLGLEQRYRARIFVKGTKEMVRGGHSIAVRQLYRNEEVGRVTWLFHRQRRRDDQVG